MRGSRFLELPTPAPPSPDVIARECGRSNFLFRAGIKPSCNSLESDANELIRSLQIATFFLMMTDEKNMEIDIKDLARAHATAAIQVLVDIMTQADAPAGARISAAKALLDRGWGKVTTQKGEERPAERDKSVQWTDLSDERSIATAYGRLGPAAKESGEEQVLRIERVIIDPKEPDQENPSPEYSPESCTYREYNRPAYGWPPATEQADLGEQAEDQAQRAPPNVDDHCDYTMNSCDEWR